MKLGVTNYADLEIQLGSYQSVQTYDAATQIELAHGAGYGDVLVKAKINAIGNDGGALAFAIMPFFKIPSSAPLISNRAAEGGITASLQYKLPGDFLFVASPEFDLLKNAADFGTHAGYRGAVSIGHAIPGIDKFSGIVEFYAQSGSDPLIPPVYTLDLGLGYLPTPNCQIDGGVNIGLNEAAPRLQFYAGITQRF